MATLEKIRQQKFWLAVLIGGALLAFIIEVGVEAIGRSAGKSVAAKVGSEKIDIMEFSKRVEQDAADEKNQQQYDAAQRNQKVMEEMINEKLLGNEYEKLGIYVTDNELSELTPLPQSCSLHNSSMPNPRPSYMTLSRTLASMASPRVA